MSAIAQAWESLVTDPPFDLSAQEIKSRTGLEPRLMAKFDHSHLLPDALAREGLFILPVRNGHYRILQGQGYHRLEPCPQAVEFPSRLEFALKTSQQGQSEMQYLDLAYNSGLLSHFLAEPVLYPTIRGRKRSPRFEFTVGRENLVVDGVQVEVDAGYEGPRTVAVLEAKMGEPQDFHLRQLYYPFRFWSQISRKPVRPIFFTYEPETETYRFREYRFDPPDRYGPPRLVQAAAYRLIVRPGRLSTINSVEKVRVPQADDLDKVSILPFLVSEGFRSHADLAEALDFTPRQSAYYCDACQMLGLLGSDLSLTSLGQTYVSLPVEARHELLCRCLLELPVLRQLVVEMLLSGQACLSREQADQVIQSSTGLSCSTTRRRRQTVFRWFSWLEKALGIVKVSPEGLELTLRPAHRPRQLVLF